MYLYNSIFSMILISVLHSDLMHVDICYGVFSLPLYWSEYWLYSYLQSFHVRMIRAFLADIHRLKRKYLYNLSTSAEADYYTWFLKFISKVM